MKPVAIRFDDRGRTSAAAMLLGRAGARSRAAAGIALVLALAGSAVVLSDIASAFALEGTLSRELAALREARPSPKAPSARSDNASLSQRRAWNQAARQLNTPWSSLLDALEASTPDSVALVSIEPDASRGTIRLQAESKSLDELMKYAAALRADSAFQSAALIKHETNDRDANRPFRLALEVRLAAPAPKSGEATR